MSIHRRTDPDNTIRDTRQRAREQAAFDYDARRHAHHDDPETSHIAAESQVPHVNDSCTRVLAYLVDSYPEGATDDEGTMALDMYSYPKRRCDLKGLGLVRAQTTGNGKRTIKRKSQHGSPMLVWIATEKGRVYATWNTNNT